MTQVFLANSAEKKKHKTTMTKTAVRKSRIMTALLSCFSFMKKESLAKYIPSHKSSFVLDLPLPIAKTIQIVHPY